jgi:hypothetical protein
MKHILNSIKDTLLLTYVIFAVIALIGLIDTLICAKPFQWEYLIWTMIYSTAFVLIFAFIGNEKISKWLTRGLYLVFIVLFFVIPFASGFFDHLGCLFFSLVLATKIEKVYLIFKDARVKSKSKIESGK